MKVFSGMKTNTNGSKLWISGIKVLFLFGLFTFPHVSVLMLTVITLHSSKFLSVNDKTQMSFSFVNHMLLKVQLVTSDHKWKTLNPM